MKQPEVIQADEHILLASDLLDQIVQVNKIIQIHEQHQADALDTKQYLHIRDEKIVLLNNLLGAWQLKVIHQEQAA